MLTINYPSGFELGESVICVPAVSSSNAGKNVKQDRVKDEGLFPG